MTCVDNRVARPCLADVPRAHRIPTNVTSKKREKAEGKSAVVGAVAGAVLTSAMVLVFAFAAATDAPYSVDWLSVGFVLCGVGLLFGVLGAAVGAIGGMTRSFARGALAGGAALGLSFVIPMLAAVVTIRDVGPLCIFLFLVSSGALCGGCGGAAARALVHGVDSPRTLQFTLREMLVLTFLLAAMASSLAYLARQ